MHILLGFYKMKVIRCTVSKTPVYKCLNCSRVRKIVQPELGLEKKNGLRQYSDLHRCADGMLAINNIQIDANSVVRAVETLELDKKDIIVRNLKLPIPNMSIFNKDLRISHLTVENDIRMIFRNEWTDRTLMIGDIKPDEKMLYTFRSKMGGISISFYDSGIEMDDNLKQWFSVLINLLDIIPPEKLGFLLESIQFIIDMRRIPPCVYDIHILENILLADKIHIQKGNGLISDIPEDEELSDNHYHIIEIVLQEIKNSPEITLLDLSEIIPDDFVYIIFLIQIMEKYGVIKLVQPSLVDEINNEYIDILID